MKSIKAENVFWIAALVLSCKRQLITERKTRKLRTIRAYKILTIQRSSKEWLQGKGFSCDRKSKCVGFVDTLIELGKDRMWQQE